MNNSIASTKKIVLAIQKVVKERQLSYDSIYEMTEARNMDDPDFPVVSVPTLSRLLREGGENGKYSYEDTLRPLATLLLDVETFDNQDKASAEALMSLLHFKKDVITENTRRIVSLEAELSSVKEHSREEINKEKAKYLDKLTRETEKFQRSLDFAKKEIELKNKQINQLMEDNHMLITQLLNCPCRKERQNEEG